MWQKASNISRTISDHEYHETSFCFCPWNKWKLWNPWTELRFCNVQGLESKKLHPKLPYELQYSPEKMGNTTLFYWISRQGNLKISGSGVCERSTRKFNMDYQPPKNWMSKSPFLSEDCTPQNHPKSHPGPSNPSSFFIFIFYFVQDMTI